MTLENISFFLTYKTTTTAILFSIFFNIIVRYFKHDIYPFEGMFSHGQSEIPKKHTQTEQDATEDIIREGQTRSKCTG